MKDKWKCNFFLVATTRVVILFNRSSCFLVHKCLIQYALKGALPWNY